ncbi:hypothetical protein B0T19DRAFT_264031 [Cercophora scortea]|uniref:Uncharacterized protein n=1 Tax=Cercophora scortea TaxID=314031 RepID=A0AAE0IAI9_9PEZI|nr:hypothetical protein B0T19DRAFT_264031 [Cercophora scortea]
MSSWRLKTSRRASGRCVGRGVVVRVPARYQKLPPHYSRFRALVSVVGVQALLGFTIVSSAYSSSIGWSRLVCCWETSVGVSIFIWLRPGLRLVQLHVIISKYQYSVHVRLCLVHLSLSNVNIV